MSDVRCWTLTQWREGEIPSVVANIALERAKNPQRLATVK